MKAIEEHTEQESLLVKVLPSYTANRLFIWSKKGTGLFLSKSSIYSSAHPAAED